MVTSDASTQLPTAVRGLPPLRERWVLGRGTMSYRDSGGDGPVVLLLHGWMFASDLNWYTTYGPLAKAGYRVLAMDHQGHGRGLRRQEPFDLQRCAEDCAALLVAIDVGPVYAVGYSMGGAIASLLARDFPHLLSGFVLSATTPDWNYIQVRGLWHLMPALHAGLALGQNFLWGQIVRFTGYRDPKFANWVGEEMSRNSARDVAQAGKELSRFDSKGWLHNVKVPAAVIVTAKDTSVPPRKQRELIAALRCPHYEVPGSHSAVVAKAKEFNQALIAALTELGAAPDVKTPLNTGFSLVFLGQQIGCSYVQS